MRSSGNNNLIIGIGNELRSDDALGVVVVNTLKEQFPNLAEFYTEQNDLTRLLDRWDAKDVVIVDAIKSNVLKVGHIHLVSSLSELMLDEEKWYLSHGIGLRQILQFGRSLEKLPVRCLFIGVSGKNWKLGAPLSAAVEQSVPRVIESILDHYRMLT